MGAQPDITESELVKDCLKGSSKAQALLYQKYSGVLYAICLRYAGNSDEAKDMLQDAFIKIFLNLGNFRFEGSFEGWIKRVTTFNCLDHLKKAENKVQMVDIENVYHLQVAETASHQIQSKQLYAALQQLPTGYRTVFNLFALEGFGHHDIAEMLGISESTSKSQLFKARKMLQQMLNLNTEKVG